MLAVVEIKYIRHEASQKGSSYAEIARRMNRDPRTVQKYVEMEDFNLQQKARKKKKAYLVLSFPYSNAFYVQVFQSQNSSST